MTERLTSPDIHLHRVMLSKHRRGPWSSSEDNYLLDLVRTHGASNWVRISQMIGTRSPKQCRERYHQNLKPSLNLEAITPEEGVMIERMVAEMGKRWAEIARRLHGRSDNAVKNWWNGGMNRRKRLDNRRAELAPRQHQHQHQHQQHHQAAAYPHHHQSSYDAYAQPQRVHEQQYQYAAPPQQSQQAPPPPHNYTVAPPPPQPSQSTHRYPVEPPLPSPSAFSTISRAESAEGQAPSLISDISYATASHPNTPPQATELPPLSLLDTRFQTHHSSSSSSHRRPSPPTSYPLSYASASSGSAKTDYVAEPPRSYPLLTEHWPRDQQRQGSAASSPTSARPTTTGQAYTGPQLPLPGFHTITGVQRPGSPTSPNKDGRMDLSKVMH